MSEMHERVAKAICRAGLIDAGHPKPDLDYAVNCCWKDYLPEGAAAIAAMREPTAEMLLAAAPFPLHLVIERNDVDYTKDMEAATMVDRIAARSTYQTMIDAAHSPAESKNAEKTEGNQ